MLRAVLLLFLILSGVIIAWLPSDVFEEDVINKYRADQIAMNQNLFEQAKDTPNTKNTKKVSSSQKGINEKRSEATPKMNPVALKVQKGQNGTLSTGNVIEQHPNHARSLPPAPVNKRTLHPLYELFEEAGETSQFYDIDNQQKTTLVSNNGALISIPSNCFMQRDGSIAIGNVTIEVRELTEKSEHLLSNITTSTFNNLLSSNGTIYLNAYADEQNLKVAPQKLLYVELPAEKRDGDTRAFFAEFDQKGKNWWSKSMPQINRMISLPLDQMAFNEMELDKSLKDHLLQPKFEQTYIATRAFEKRMQLLERYQNLFPIEDLVNIYTHYIEADLKESDSKVAYYFGRLAKEQTANPKLAQKFQKLANHFKYFALERYTKPVYLNPYHLNLADADAYNQLLAKGMSVFSANMYLQMNNCREYLIAERSKGNAKTWRKKRAKNSFMIHRTGWFSINEFLPANGGKRKMMAQIENSKDPKASLYLVLDSYNTVVAAKKDKEGNYLFSNLPLGGEWSFGGTQLQT